MAKPAAAKPLRNADIDWESWPVEEYLAETYRELHPADAAIIDHHSAFYRGIPADSLALSLELGAGPNLYPIMLACAASRRIDAVDKSAGNVEYLRRQLRDGPDESWQPFYTRCRDLNPALPATLAEALTRVRVSSGDALDLHSGTNEVYDLASMHFLAEGATQSAEEFERFCQAFVESVRPGGLLIAAFMERMDDYHFADQTSWPAYPVDSEVVRRVFAPHTVDLQLSRVDIDQAVTESFPGTGMVLLTARRRMAPTSA
jgi:hypothetical protein